MSDCRMYENKFPEVDDVVMVQVKSIAEMGAYVSLLEYNGVEGMILLSELSRRRIRSISKLIKVGRQEPVMVLRVDAEKGYIDLSKRRVSPEDVARCEDRFNKSKLVHSIVRHVAETCSEDLISLYEHVVWPLYKTWGHAFEAFRASVYDQDVLAHLKRSDGEPSMSEAVLLDLGKSIKRRMTPQPLKIRADVEMTDFSYDGVLHIKDAMRAAEKCSTETCPVSMKLIAAPLYVLTTQTLDKSAGLEILDLSIQAAAVTVSSHRGKLVVKESPRAVSERDDRLLAEKMEAMAAANAEQEGDSDSEGSQDETMGNIDVDRTAGIVESGGR